MKSNLFFLKVTLETHLMFSLALWDALEHRIHAPPEACV